MQLKVDLIAQLGYCLIQITKPYSAPRAGYIRYVINFDSWFHRLESFLVVVLGH